LRRSAQGSSRSRSPGSAPLGLGAHRDLAARHGIRPSKSLGQSFLVDPNLARAIVADAAVGPADRVLEIGPGLGALTVPLADTGAEVLAVEFDRALEPALREVLGPFPRVRLEIGDALRIDWPKALGDGEWKLISNLPYNIAVPLLLDMLEGAPQIRSYLVMVQRVVGERLVAEPGEQAYGSVSVRVGYRADATLVRRVPASVFWPRPKVESVLVRLTPRTPPVDVDRDMLFRVVEEGFAERRKTMTNALRRLGLDAPAAVRVMTACGLRPDARAESLALREFARVADALVHEAAPRGDAP
jgi:16S rRNA (adenine1518-N6/adenine1519-N6)-dimethyltransferase